MTDLELRVEQLSIEVAVANKHAIMWHDEFQRALGLAYKEREKWFTVTKKRSSFTAG